MVSHIRGIFDVIVEDRVSGRLCPVGDAARFADAVAWLASDRNRLLSMSAAARATVERRYTIERMAAEYARLFCEGLGRADSRAPALAIDVDAPLLSKPRLLGSLIPTWLKKYLRNWLERRGRSV